MNTYVLKNAFIPQLLYCSNKKELVQALLYLRYVLFIKYKPGHCCKLLLLNIILNINVFLRT